MTVRQDLWFYKSVANAEVVRTPAEVHLPNWGKFSSRTLLYEFYHTTKSAPQQVQRT